MGATIVLHIYLIIQTENPKSFAVEFVRAAGYSMPTPNETKITRPLVKPKRNYKQVLKTVENLIAENSLSDLIRLFISTDRQNIEIY